MKNKGDLISRSEAEKLGATCLARRNENGQLEAIISLDNAPTVEYTFEEAFQKTVCEQRLYCPQRPQGEWLDIYATHIAYECSNCHMQMPITNYFNFCPNCGADMRGKEE